MVASALANSSLFRSMRVRSFARISAFSNKTNLIQDFLGFFSGSFHILAWFLAIHPAHHHILQGREFKEWLDQLEGSGNALLADLITRKSGDILPLKDDRAGIRFQESGQQV